MSLVKYDTNVIDKCLSDQTISSENRSTLREFDKLLRATDRRVGTRKNYILTGWQLAKVIGESPFREDNEKDEKKLMTFINLLKEGSEEFGWKPLKPSTLNSVKTRIRRFYKWLYRNELREQFQKAFGRNPSKREYQKWYPTCVDWMEFETFVTKIDTNSFLTPEEYNRVLSACRTQQQRAIICAMRHGDLNIGEALSLNIEDVKLMPDGTVTLDLTEKTLKTKYRSRKQDVVQGSQDILLWLRQNPYYNMSPEEIKEPRPLFVNTKGKRLTYHSWRIQHKHILKRAGIKKPYHSHLYRHEGLTEDAVKHGM